jgi:anaerobic selenocysteine-containing dehydrogenase
MTSVQPPDAAPAVARREVPVYCPLCVSRCGARATVVDGELVELKADPSHPTGSALCLKGKAAPAIVRHPDRLLQPLRRTAPKGSADPGWVRISWEEALDEVATRLTALAREHGPECVVFGSASPSTSAMSDAIEWLTRLRRAFGSPNLVAATELCGWGRFFAPLYTFGASVPGTYLPDLDRAGVILYWGYNPSVARLSHATATTAALRRGARLVVVDPRRVGLASKADHWLRARPGSDGALALAMTHVLLENTWYDVEFVRRWTNSPLLVRSDTGRLLRAAELDPGASPAALVAWDEVAGRPATYDPVTGRYQVDEERLALSGTRVVPTVHGEVACRPVLELVRSTCAQTPPSVAEGLTGVAADDIVAAARTLWESRPLAFYTWSGLEQHSNSTQTVRAIGQLFALTGSLDVPGGNVLFPAVPSNPVDGPELISAQQRVKALGIERRPLGPARFEYVTGEDLYTAALEGDPYRARALVTFGTNLVMAHGDSARGRDALSRLDFMVHADLFLSPTAELADIVLPVTSPFESEALRIGFETSAEAQSMVQLRPAVTAGRGGARSDLRVIFDLAVRLGLGDHFFGGDLDAAWRHQLAPSGITLEQLRAEPGGVRVPLTTRYRKHEILEGAVARGFRTPSRKVELYSQALAEHGYPPVPVYKEPLTSPRSRPDLAERYPLVLTCAKSLFFCETQHRHVAELRASAPEPQVELNRETAEQRGITAGDWVRIETPHGSVRARAKLSASLAAGVVCAQHGWWQGCDELGLPGYPPFGPDTANLNLVLRQGPSDPVGGSAPLRASLCEVTRE